jgi:DNA-binding transcriptional regulator LsrR (DeoR family)
MEIERLELLASIAKMWFIDNMTQAQIASRCGYSRSMISRLLDEARDQGIVEVRIKYPLARNETLETQLINKFDLKVARVLMRETLSEDELVRRLGILAARLLDELVGPAMTIGVGWGTALSEMVNSASSKSFLDIHVVQLIGAPGAEPEFDGPGLVQRLARTYGGSYSTISAPLLVDSEQTRESLMKDRRIQAVLLNAEDMDIAIFGIGDISSIQSSLRRSGYLTDVDVESLLKVGAVGDVCAYVFDVNGNLVNHPIVNRIVGVGPDVLRNAPIRLGVAGGHYKTLPILGALRGSFINVLVTDDVVADSLIKLQEND